MEWMKTIMKLLAGIVVILALLYFIWGIPPKDVPGITWRKIQSFGSGISKGVSDFSASASKLKSNVDDRMNEAKDVYDGKAPKDPYAGRLQ